MSYKLVALDIDGTILNSERKVTDKTMRTIREASLRGLLFTLCTSRSNHGSQPYLNIVTKGLPVILYEGGVIKYPDTNKIVHKSCIDSIYVKQLLHRYKSRNVSILVWAEEGLYTDNYSSTHANRQTMKGYPVEHLSNLDIDNSDIYYIAWYCDENVKADIGNYVDHYCDEKLRGVTYFRNSIRIYSKDANKGNALSKLGELLHIRSEEIVAIGDYYNDIPMFDYAGLGVAMMNAPDEVKSHANLVTKSRNEEGVACFLEELLELNIAV